MKTYVLYKWSFLGLPNAFRFFRHEDHDASDAESSSGASVKSGASSLLSRRRMCHAWRIIQFTGQIIATSRDLTSKGSRRREIPFFQRNLGW